MIWIYGTAPLFPWATLRGAKTEAEFMAMARDSAERYRSAVVDMRRLIDWAATQPEIDADAHRVRRLQHERARHRDAARQRLAHRRRGVHDGRRALRGRVRELRRPGRARSATIRCKTFGWTLDQYRNFFAGLFDPADPTMYAGHYDPDKILMIDTMFDDCMPESARAALWEVTGRPERITLLYHHRTRVLLADAARPELHAPQDLSLSRQRARDRHRLRAAAIDIT